jgi:hypothetical protein
MVEPFNTSVEMDYDKMVYENKGWGHNMTGGEVPFHTSVEMEYDEMVYNKEHDKIMAGGYSVNSILLNQGMPAAYADNVGGKKNTHANDKVSDRFKHLAVPAGLYLGTNTMHSNHKSNVNNMNDSTVINDDLYEKLLKLAQDNNKGRNNNEKINNKREKSKKKSTRKNKNKKSIKHKTKKRK